MTKIRFDANHYKMNYKDGAERISWAFKHGEVYTAIGEIGGAYIIVDAEHQKKGTGPSQCYMSKTHFTVVSEHEVQAEVKEAPLPVKEDSYSEHQGRLYMKSVEALDSKIKHLDKPIEDTSHWVDPLDLLADDED